MASQEATKRYKQMSLMTPSPMLDKTCRSLSLVTDFIAKVGADVHTFKGNMIIQLASDKTAASKQMTALVMAAFKEANPNAIVPNFPASSPSSDYLRAVSAPVATLAKKMFQPC